MNEIKVGKLPIIANYVCNCISKLVQGAKIWWIFAQLYKHPTDCFVLEVSAVSRSYGRIWNIYIYIYIYICICIYVYMYIYMGLYEVQFFEYCF